MALVNLKDLLSDAKEKKYGVFATDVPNFDFAEAAINAAEEKNSPIIIMVCEALFKYFNFKTLVKPIISLAKEASVPIVLHLDHGDNLDIIYRSIKSGLNSVMYDGSKHALDENINIVKEITKIAHILNVSTEGEVGVIGGREGDINVENKIISEENFTLTEEAVRFSKETNVDALAISIGTVHGVFKSKPNINFDRILEINNAVDTPIVMHGSSGLSDDDFKKAIKNGMTKINYYTNLIVEATKKAKELINDHADYDYLELNYQVLAFVKEIVKKKLDIFGSTGKG